MTETDIDRPRSAVARPKFRLIFLLLVTALMVVWYLVPGSQIPDGISESDYRRAEQTFLSLHGTRPEPVDTMMTLGEMATQEERNELAIRCFDQIPSNHPKYGSSARLQEGQLLAHIGLADKAEAQLREYLQLTDENAVANRENRKGARQWLHYLLSAELRFEERKTLLEEGHLKNECGLKDSNLLYFPHLLVWNTASAWEPLRKYLAHDPDNPVFQIAHARYLTGEGRLDEARALLEDLVEKRPDDLSALAAYLECLHALAEDEALAETMRRAPDYAPEEPWLLTRMRGEVAAAADRWEEATQYYQKVLEADPTNPECTMGLARAYGAMGRLTEQKAMLQRSLVLADIRVFLARVRENDPEEIRALAGKCEKIGLVEAARTYREYAEQIERELQKSKAGRPFP